MTLAALSLRLTGRPGPFQCTALAWYSFQTATNLRGTRTAAGKGRGGRDLNTLEVDGSHGEGGGQVLRTALSLAALTGTELLAHSIRAGRSRPGLAAQHLTAVHAAADVCGATLEGDAIGSQQLRFTPGPVVPGEYEFDVARLQPSAGSATLVLQTLIPPLLFAASASQVVIHGGTNVPWSPPVEFVQGVFVPALAALGVGLTVTCPRGGWYPSGGGELRATIEPLGGALGPVDLMDPGELRELSVISTVSADLPEHIAARQMRAALAELPSEFAQRARLETRRPEGGPGTCLAINGRFASGFAGANALGERRKPAEEVGREAAAAWSAFMASGAGVDRRLADQLLLYAALAHGTSRFTSEASTSHLRTNAWVIEQFLGPRITLDGDSPARVTVTGAGFTHP
jgi:RNA 3'-terminal phosphate cyclase (ATP)